MKASQTDRLAALVVVGLFIKLIFNLAQRQVLLGSFPVRVRLAYAGSAWAELSLLLLAVVLLAVGRLIAEDGADSRPMHGDSSDRDGSTNAAALTLAGVLVVITAVAAAIARLPFAEPLTGTTAISVAKSGLIVALSVALTLQAWQLWKAPTSAEV